jgi:hypothetical protein
LRSVHLQVRYALCFRAWWLEGVFVLLLLQLFIAQPCLPRFIVVFVACFSLFLDAVGGELAEILLYLWEIRQKGQFLVVSGTLFAELPLNLLPRERSYIQTTRQWCRR